MSHALVPVAGATQKTAEKTDTPDAPAPTSVIVAQPKVQPTAQPTAGQKTKEPAPTSVVVTSAPQVIQEPETNEAEGSEAPQTGTPTASAPKKKKPKKKAPARWRTFESLVLPEDRPAVAGAWGLSPADPRVSIGLSGKQSFDYLNAVPAGQRKLLRESDIRDAVALTEQDWTDRRRERRATLNDADRQGLRKLWAMDPEPFDEALKGEPQYRWVRDLPDVHRRAVTVADIRKQPELSAAEWAERRRLKVSTLIEADLQALAQEWKIPIDDPRFKAASASQQCYDFVRGLHADNRPAATVEIIAAAKPVSAKAWTKLRREHLATMTEQDRQAVVQSWGLDPDDKRVLLALAKEETYQYFSTMTKLQREWVSWNKFKSGKVPSDDDIENAKKQAATIAAQEQAKKEKEQRAEAAKKKREATAKGWADYQGDVRERVRKRVETELPDFDWQKLVDSALGATGQKIKASPEINLQPQINATEAVIDAGLQRETKRREIEAAAALADPRLRTLATIKKEVLADDSLTSADFTTRVTKAWRDQRNPTEPAVWARWMSLKMFSDGGAKPFVSLADVADPALSAHFTVDWAALSLPTVVDTTTADDILNQLFSPVGKNKFDLAHVTLETGVERAPDQLALPHRYWSKIGDPASYELRFGGGNIRWDAAKHDEADITAGLDAAYAEILGVLRVRAQHVLAAGGPP